MQFTVYTITEAITLISDLKGSTSGLQFTLHMLDDQRCNIDIHGIDGRYLWSL